MADIRKLVVDDRGWIKKLQNFLPGYKKYRTCEDLRAADSMLRKELAIRLSHVEESIKRSREEITRNMEMDLINRIGELVNISHRLTEKVRHAEQGYAPWISGDVRIEEDELNKLYEYDLSLVDHIEKLFNEAKKLEEATINKATDRTQRLASMRGSIEEFESVFGQRIAKVTNVAQRK
ncbi:MAG: hypothetical protein JXA22_04625 [Candidatus Thermoplasmatota archaeon]|nr:hypothetical protein [Candidatus Thermoplasmatota archaeon]